MHPLRNPDYPNTHIAQILVSLDDPDHWVTLIWSGPQAGGAESGPFKSSPGAGLVGLDCDDPETSMTNGSLCTPKGARMVEGFAPQLSDDSRATHVTFFDEARAIGLHYFPEAPSYPASHGCVRLQSDHAAQLIYDNSVVGVTQVSVTGTWTKPPKQWPRS
jgi:hypothetical protein